MYYSNDYLCHYGVLGMKWGQHIYGDRGTGSSSETDRRIGDGKSNSARKRQVNSERREARNRIAFYGGKNAARANIDQERDYKVRRVKDQMSEGIGKAAEIGGAIAIGGLVLGAMVAGSTTGAAARSIASLVALSSIPGGAAVGGYLSSVTAKIGNKTIKEIEDRAERQTAYTDDMAVKATTVTASDPDKDDD